MNLSCKYLHCLEIPCIYMRNTWTRADTVLYILKFFNYNKFYGNYNYYTNRSYWIIGYQFFLDWKNGNKKLLIDFYIVFRKLHRKNYVIKYSQSKKWTFIIFPDGLQFLKVILFVFTMTNIVCTCFKLTFRNLLWL